ncbi:sigma-70 family RNA polymerase sigma factor [Verrucomicrobiaceae bacterium 227]
MLKLKAGDDSALNEIMDYWETPLTSFLQRSTGIYEDAVDLAQETFVRLYKSRDRYQESARFSTWIFTIAANLSRNHARWKKRHPTDSLEALQETRSGKSQTNTTDKSLTPDAALSADERAYQVRAAIDQLAPDMREAILLSQYQGLSQLEIAEIQKCSAKAVESKIYRARMQLREILKDLFES